MSKKYAIGTILIGLMGFVYIRNFTNWFRRPEIHIAVTSRPGRPGAEPDGAAPIVFGLDREYEVRSVEVISLSSLETNKVPVAVWHLESKKKAKLAAVRGFPYGDNLEGLEPRPTLPEPQPLVPGMPYRIEVTAAHGHGQRDFTPVAAGE